MGLREDELVDAMVALCADREEGERTMLVVSGMASSAATFLEGGYRVARAGGVLAVWRDDEAARLGEDPRTEGDCANRAWSSDASP